MKRIVFVISHIGANAETFVTHILNENPRIDILTTGLVYKHPTDIDSIAYGPHKLNNSAAIYGDLLLHNTNFSCPNLYPVCKFIYIIREAGDALNEDTFYPRKYKEAYYRFRLRRLFEMARNTPGAVLLTWDDMRSGKGNPLIEDYLSLKEPLITNPELFKKSTKEQVPAQVVEHCQDTYEKYLFKMRSLGLRKV